MTLRDPLPCSLAFVLLLACAVDDPDVPVDAETSGDASTSDAATTFSPTMSSSTTTTDPATTIDPTDDTSGYVNLPGLRGHDERAVRDRAARWSREARRRHLLSQRSGDLQRERRDGNGLRQLHTARAFLS
jgi:hypothetical protein